MLNPDLAQEEIKRFHLANGAKRRQDRVAKLPAKIREAGYGLMGRDAKGRPCKDRIDYRYGTHVADGKLDSLKPAHRRKLFTALFPKIAQHVDAAWEMRKRYPYHSGWARKPFRAPHNERASRRRRTDWLRQTLLATEGYEQDIVWFAAWAPHLGGYYISLDTFGMLFAAAVDSGGKEGEQVFEILRDSAGGQHEIGGMGRHVTQGLLSCSRPEAWEFCEKLLLAAQRQEGLRQTILETIDEAHPEAFRRMLKLILDENLVRFSATVRAVDVWLGFQWDSVSTGVVRDTVQRLSEYLEDPNQRQAAIEGDDPESVFIALWCVAFEDAEEAIPPAIKLLKHKNVEHRFVAQQMLIHLGLVESMSGVYQTLEDDDLRLTMIAVGAVSGSESHYDAEELDGVKTHRPKDLFERLEAVIDRFPKKKQTLEALVWPWWKLTAERREVARALVANLGERPATRLIPYLRDMGGYTRAYVAGKLAEAREWDAATRRTLFALIGDPSCDVREKALDAVVQCSVTADEVLGLEKMLSRKSADLRRGVLAILLKRSGDRVLASAERLMAGQQMQRLAGLELLRQLVDGGREVKRSRVLAEAYQTGRKKLSADEATMLEAVLSRGKNVATLDDALGLCDISARTKPQPPKRHKVKFATKAAGESIKALDDLIHAHRETSIEIEQAGDEKTELLGNVHWGFPYVNLDTPVEKDVTRLPLIELWTSWWEKRPEKLRDADGLELVRAVAIVDQNRSYGQPPPSAATFFGKLRVDKLRYHTIVSTVLHWLLRLNPTPAAHDYLLDAAETALAMVPANQLGRLEQTPYSPHHDLPWRSQGPYVGWLQMAEMHQRYCAQGWSEAHETRIWNIYRWLDEPRVKKVTLVGKLKRAADKPTTIGRCRPDLTILIRAHKWGAATEADVLDQLLGPRYASEWGSVFLELGLLTGRKRPKQFAEEEWLWPLVDRCRDRVLEIELCRGETPTAASGPASVLRSVWGTDNVIRILAALGKGTLIRGYSYAGGDNKNSVFSSLLRVALPGETDTAGEFKTKARAAGISEERLLDLAVYSPQWAQFVEHALEWPGLEDAVWWVHAHTKDSQWSIDAEIRETWQAALAERTPLTAQDLLDGGVDVEWFHRVYGQLKKKRWESLLKSAKYAAGGGGHKRAELFAGALLGREKKTELAKRVNQKRYQDAVRALGLLPLDRGKAREKDLLDRYKTMQEFIRGSRQFGSQRQASEKRAATIGQQNLARTAGYADPIRLQWAMEAHAVADLSDGPLTLTFDDVSISLAIEETGDIEFTVQRGDKLLKAVPAALKKNKQVKELRQRRTELRRQVSRIRPSLEQMMCRGDTFRGEELIQLMTHPFIGPMLGRLVLVGKGHLGYPVRGGKALENCQGEVTAVKQTGELRIAHPADLFETGNWHRWQQDCFGRERIQPFKQVFRELYPVTKAELKDKTLSRRYAGHQVNPRQALALLGGRGWVSVPEEGVRRTFHEEGFSAWLEFLESFFTPADVEGLTLEGVRFSKPGEWKPLELDKIPPRLFSEVMRDLDLVVSVAHRGGVDPEASASTIEMRTDLMRETLAVLNIENVEFKKNHAIIRGDYGQYSVHLGSGVTHKMPGAAMLIVPIHSQHRGRVFLPFADDDPKTAEVLSKVLLLARDREIQDPNILDQIRVLSSLVPDKGAADDTKRAGKRPGEPARAKSEMDRRYFELVDDKSRKFWEVAVDGNDVTVRYGRIGAKGRSSVKTFGTAADAQDHASKLIRQKTNKGYGETDSSK